MRLIDADLVLDKMRNTFDMQDLYLPTHFKELIIDDLPTVEALPIEKLEQMRAEIEQAFCKVENNYDHGRNYGLYMATQIINKYRQEG